jgi:aromatic-L-amino-acid/L-tryptophan decarboxylase
MEQINDFRASAHKMVDWIADYYQNIGKYPVKSQSEPGDIYSRIPAEPPQEGDNSDNIMSDFDKIIMPGLTHWQSPNFFAYFPANTSFPSILGEMLTAAIGAQCMKWETSPAATELEEAMMNWLRQMTGLPDGFTGVIQDSASTATLCAILSAREKYNTYITNSQGVYKRSIMRVYCSEEAHSSVEKAVKIAGLGSENLVKIETDNIFRMVPSKLEEAIDFDIRCGYYPLAVVAALGTTGPTSVDPLAEIARISSEYDMWLHVDAAYAGSALILPEFRWMIKGIEKADSIVFNPHKWMFTNFDCSAYFVRDPDTLINTFKLVPEYLKSQLHEHVNDFSNWGIQLGRRFRALKLWFVIRSFGVQGLQEKLRYQIKLALWLKGEMQKSGNFDILAPVSLNLICFRYHPAGMDSEEQLNTLNEKILLALNGTGKMYITHTKLKGKYTLRFAASQTYVREEHVRQAWDIIRQKAQETAKHFDGN